MAVAVTLEVSGLVGVVVTLGLNGLANRRFKKNEAKTQRVHEKEVALHKITADKLAAEKVAEVEKIKAVEIAIMGTKLDNLTKRFDSETGGNSGGLREAVNSVSDRLVGVETMIRDHVQFHMERPA